MKTIAFFAMCAVAVAFLLYRMRLKPSRNFRSVDAIVPAFNEEPCIEPSLRMLLRNPYNDRVICVNDGSTDDTAKVLEWLSEWNPRLIVVDQENSGKGGAIMNGLEQVRSNYVFLTDADTHVPSRSKGLGYLLAELERGADAVGGIPSSKLDGTAGLLPRIRASVKLPMIVAQRTFQQIVGGAPFLVSGACGMFRADVIRKIGFSDRTKVEDLDFTWSLVANGYKVRQANRCVVYTEEANNIGDEWRRWRRWISGYAVCMRLHRQLLFTRYGLLTIIPMFLVAVLGLGVCAFVWSSALVQQGPAILPALMFPAMWLMAALAIGLISAVLIAICCCSSIRRWHCSTSCSPTRCG